MSHLSLALAQRGRHSALPVVLGPTPAHISLDQSLPPFPVCPCMPIAWVDQCGISCLLLHTLLGPVVLHPSLAQSTSIRPTRQTSGNSDSLFKVSHGLPRTPSSSSANRAGCLQHKSLEAPASRTAYQSGQSPYLTLRTEGELCCCVPAVLPT